MNPSHEREQALFILAATKPAEERAAFLDRECGGDTSGGSVQSESVAFLRTFTASGRYRNVVGCSWLLPALALFPDAVSKTSAEPVNLA